jgi:hypothetical protein
VVYADDGVSGTLLPEAAYAGLFDEFWKLP